MELVALLAKQKIAPTFPIYDSSQNLTGTSRS